MSVRSIAVIVFALSFVPARFAFAQNGPGCTPSPRPFVTLRFGDGVAESSRDEILREIDHELRGQQIDLCDGVRPGDALATVAIDAQSAAVSIRLQVRDVVKDVSREIDTSSIPADGRALLVAASAVDLLRASWAEPAPRELPKTIIVERVIVAPRPPPPSRFASLELALANETFTTGLSRFGADARFGFRPISRLDLGAVVGVRRALVQGAPHGSISSDALVAGADVRVGLTAPLAHAGLDAIARFVVARMSFVGHAGVHTDAAVGTLPSMELSGGLRAWLSITTAFDVALTVTAGAAILAANATDAGVVASSTEGLMVASSLALTGHF